MGQCNRLVNKLVEFFPTANREQVTNDLDLCRKQDKLGTTDWEGMRAKFKRVVLYAFKFRHITKPTDYDVVSPDGKVKSIERILKGL